MPQTQNNISWYEITKDIAIPLLEVAATIVVGAVIVYLLKGKEERLKKKNLLIDT